MENSKCENLKDIAYTAVGISILGFQRGMTMKVDAEKKINEHLGTLTTTIKRLANSVQ